MQNTPDLTAEEKEFFALVQEAIFANPFGKERAGLDAKIAGACSSPPGAYSIENTVQAVRERIALLDQRQLGRGPHPARRLQIHQRQ